MLKIRVKITENMSNPNTSSMHAYICVARNRRGNTDRLNNKKKTSLNYSRLREIVTQWKQNIKSVQLRNGLRKSRITIHLQRTHDFCVTNQYSTFHSHNQ